MKKGFKVTGLLLAVFGLFSVLSINAHAEEEMPTEEEIANVDEDINVVEDHAGKESPAQSFLNQHFGWIVGIPAGMGVAIVGEAILLVLKSRRYKEETGNVSLLVGNTKTMISSVRDGYNENKEYLIELIKAEKERIALDKAILEDNKNIKASLMLMAAHSEELVRTGVAEEVCAKLNAEAGD